MATNSAVVFTCPAPFMLCTFGTAPTSGTLVDLSIMANLKIPVRLQPKQWKLYDSLKNGTARIVGCGGGRGSAKSGGIDRIAIALMLEQPGITLCIVMRTYEQLRKYHIDPLLRTYPQLGEYYFKTDKKLVLPNGSQLDLGYAENYDAVEEFSARQTTSSSSLTRQSSSWSKRFGKCIRRAGGRRAARRWH